MNKNMVVFNFKNLKADALDNFKRIKAEKGYKSVSQMFAINGMSDSTWANSKGNYLGYNNGAKNNKEIIDRDYVTDGIENEVGALSNYIYESILAMFELQDVYRIPKRMPDINPDIKVSSVEPQAQVQAQASNDEVIKAFDKLNKTMDDIAYALLLISEQMQNRNNVNSSKPIAVIKKGE